MATIFKKTLAACLAAAAVLSLGACGKKGQGEETTAETTYYTVNPSSPSGAEVSEKELVSGDFKYTLYADGNATLNAYTGSDHTLDVPE